MLVLGPIGFLVPWLLAALLALPVLWWLLRAIPPRPLRLKFPAVSLLLGLKDPEKMPDKTPWWLLLLRIAALAAAIIGFAGPILNPVVRAPGSGPLLVLIDGGWASAQNWGETRARIEASLQMAKSNGRPVVLHAMADPVPPDNALSFQDAETWLERLPGLEPRPWAADRLAFADWLRENGQTGFETIWLADGLGSDADPVLFRALQKAGPVTFWQPGAAISAVSSVSVTADGLSATVLRNDGTTPAATGIQAIGADLNGTERILAQGPAEFAAGETSSDALMTMPLELRNRVSRVVLADTASAGSTYLLGDAAKRRKVGLLAGVPEQEAQQYTSPLFFLRKALQGSTEVIEAPLADMLLATPDVLILADVGTLTEPERTSLTDWVEAGGLLVRFAGPRLAKSGAGSLEDDPLLPVRLRAGGRNLGGAMSWGSPRQLRAFPETSPFFGLAIPAEVTVTSQVMAQPGPDLQGKVLAALDDGTPMVTARPLGQGRVVLFHVTANADWSNLPLSGLFVQMLERLAVTAQGMAPAAEDLAGQVWTPQKLLDGFGRITDAEDLAGVPGERLNEGRPGPDAPPGLYASGDRVAAINLLKAGDTIRSMAALPAGVTLDSGAAAAETSLKAPFLTASLLLLLTDILATLWIGGRMTAVRMARVAIGTLIFLAVLPPHPARADDADAITAANETVLAYVVTGDAALDQVSRAGLYGLTRILNERTAVEPVDPRGVDIETDELAFYPFLYWPVSELQPMPSPAAYARLNDYLRNGGMILFDTRDADLGAAFGTTPNGRALQRLAAGLDIPPLEPMPPDHVLTRTFYLLQEFPGRWTGSEVWVEASPDTTQAEGMPFRNLNDGVTPVIIGANDWAAAWAMDEEGVPIYPVGRGIGGERQREIAWRFGVNLVMHVMTGNYKSDQVHVPALLERLGQ